MEVTYISHSGFLVELERTLLLFDYYQGGLPPLDPAKKLYVFASHAHADHFNFEIFALEHPDPVYVCSDDIRKARSAGNFARHGVDRAVYDRIVFLKPHERWSDGAVAVETLDSTDEGVAFLVEAEGRALLHMGDLHRWVWDDEPEEDNRRIKAKWNAELARIAGRRFDAVFAVLDPRQEGEFWRGLDQLMGTVDAGKVYPMHMWDQPELVDRLRALPCSAPYRSKLPPLSFYQEN